ncbi:NAD(P)-dependent alcohol dehydrogenase [Micromonospora phytophila]|uniref:NAD(P)-dependent alcohol dehydrogenase n=1 Tax=Micromonospora phytophila TaxID=709888 RepID=UPI00202E867F|nr:NAD(P)-dependent alcohol dehydrogenase [Micromonospora phytophila]MCM0674093.1 NAD(P)-dependent alcohol dehydrogenase [Micromonospora phytophila]
MKAIVQDGYGPPEALELRDVDVPAAGPDEVLVRVRAAGVDPGVWHLTTGLPYAVRLAAGLRRPRQRVPGLDLAGVVAAVGRDVTRFAPGDEVYGTGMGSWAEYAVAPARKLAPKPRNLSFAQAAAVPVSGQTALAAVREVGRVRPGQDVLVIGAGGGVGSFAVQLATCLGARVTGVCGPTKLDLVRSLGAQDVVDHTSTDITDAGRRYDVIVDTGGNRSLTHLRRALAPKGTLVLVGGEASGGRWLQGFDRQLRALLLSPFVGGRLVPLVAPESAAHLTALTELIEAGTVTPALDRSWPLAEAPTALRHIAGGHSRGKAVITI